MTSLPSDVQALVDNMVLARENEASQEQTFSNNPQAFSIYIQGYRDALERAAMIALVRKAQRQAAEQGPTVRIIFD